MRRFLKYLPPSALLIGICAWCLGFLEISLLEISAFELRWSRLNFEWHYKKGDVFTGSESVSRDKYEVGYISWFPDFKDAFATDMHKLAKKRKLEANGDAGFPAFFIHNYRLQVCPETKRMDIQRTDLFTKSIDLEILASLEIYDHKTDSLLYSSRGQKFRSRNKIEIRGFSSSEFLMNKIDELWLAQVANNVPQYIHDYQTDNYGKRLRKAIRAYVLFSYFYSPEKEDRVDERPYYRYANFLSMKDMDEYIKANEQ